MHTLIYLLKKVPPRLLSFRQIILLSLSCLFAAQVIAQDRGKIHEALKVWYPSIKLRSIVKTDFPSIFRVEGDNGLIAYSDAKGKNIIVGEHFQRSGDELVNLTENVRQNNRAKRLADLVPRDYIDFKPNRRVRAIAYVFTDVTCPYCQQMHKDMEKYHRLGIEIRYLAFPRAGINSDSYFEHVSAWCDKDPQKAITLLKNRQSIPLRICKNNPVAMEFGLGEEFNVRGTPTIVTSDGRLFRGYLQPLELAKRLGLTP